MSAVLRRKNVKKGFTFAIMVVGCSGLGKSTFVNTLVGRDVTSTPTAVSAPSDGSAESLTSQDDGDTAPSKTIRITPYTVDLDEDGFKLTLTVIDTPGFGDSINNDSASQQIFAYISEQFDEVLLEETRIKRNPKFEDVRVHALLYFLQPSGHGLKELDVDFMKRLGAYVNIIPIVAKADSMTTEELLAFKENVREDLRIHKIPTFAFPSDPEEDDDETIAENEELRGMFVVGGNRQVRGRKYAWGICETDNARHCDYGRLRYVLLRSHIQDLKDITHDELYENYRTQKLSLEESVVSLNADGIGEIRVDAVKQVMIKGDLLKKEEEKLREMEVKVNKEIEQKRRMLLQKEQSLKELELRLATHNESGDDMREGQ